MGRLSELTSGFGRSVSELTTDTDEAYNARSQDRMANRPYSMRSSEFDREGAPKDDMRKYWRQYETTPIVRYPINTFANRVVEPGYYIEYDGDLEEDTNRDLEHWLETCAIVEGVTGRDIRFILKKAVIQREVRGTAISEVVFDESRENIVSLKLLNPETIEINTRPGQSLLLKPEDSEKWEDCPQTPEGDAAAYVQDLSDANVSWGVSIRKDRDENSIAFTKDEIIKLTRDADVGETFGTSRIESVSDTIEGLKQKVSDNNEAIASKAYPLWLFKFGIPEAPWPRDDIDSFMRHHEMEDFHPGMKQGVRGDVKVDTVSGEVAEIAEYLEFDLNWILTAMPMPRYALGAFQQEAAGGQEAAMGQQSNINLQIKEARREIEAEFTGVVRKKAEELGVSEDEAKKMKFRIGSPGEDEDVPTNIQEIHYKGKDDPKSDTDPSVDTDNPSNIPDPEDDTSSDDESPKSSGPRYNSPPDVPIEEEEENTVWDRPGVAQLARSEEADLADVIEDIFVEARDSILDTVQGEFAASPTHAAYNFPSRANSQLTDSFRGRQFRHTVSPIIDDTITGVVEESSERAVQRRQDKRLFVQDIESSVYDAVDDMMGKMNTQLRKGAHDGDSFDRIRERIENEFSDGSLSSRANIIAQMELHNTRETVKLSAYEEDPDVIGVRVSNGNASTPVCQELGGVEVYFEDGDIGEQLREKVSDTNTRSSFDPLPTTPPYHFGCSTQLEAIKNV